ncbi:MAG: hypothetical protein IJH67_07575 [Thermoguttaceae bacterium]|nr:hypothetical protein [Thermoguttaceae bacterium]
MNDAIKNRIVATIAVIVVLCHIILCRSLIQIPKEIYWAICYQLELNSDTSFHGIINSVVKGIRNYSTINQPLSKNNGNLWIDVYGICVKCQDLYRLHNSNYRIVRLLNNSLSVCSDYDNMVITSKDLISFKEYLDKRGIPMLYVIAPHKNYKYHSLAPRGVKDFETENCNRLISQIEDHVSYIDNRELFKNNPDQHYQLFYTGDSHWKVQYAYLSYCQIMQYMEEQYSIIFEKKLKSIENFSVYSIDRPGDLSDQYGRFYLPQEVFLYMNPKFKTHLRILSNNNGCNIDDVDYTGVFDMTILCKLYPTLKVFNPDAVNKKKLMVIGDSFSPPVMSFLCLSFERVEFHAVNYYKDSLRRDIEEFQPDYVICIFTSRQTALPIFKEFSE